MYIYTHMWESWWGLDQSICPTFSGTLGISPSPACSMIQSPFFHNSLGYTKIITLKTRNNMNIDDWWLMIVITLDQAQLEKTRPWIDENHDCLIMLRLFHHPKSMGPSTSFFWNRALGTAPRMISAMSWASTRGNLQQRRGSTLALRMELGCFLEGSLGFMVIWLIFPEIYYLENL